MTDPADNNPQREPVETAALKRIGPPARLLLFLSVLNLVGVVYLMVRAIALKKQGPDANMRESWDEMQKKPGAQEMFPGWTAGTFLTVTANTFLGYGAISGLVSVLTLAGARRMIELRSYGLAVTAAVLAAIPCMTPCCLLGQVAGVWAFVILMQPDVRKAFQ